jgi:hypothetical protein
LGLLAFTSMGTTVNTLALSGSTTTFTQFICNTAEQQ